MNLIVTIILRTRPLTSFGDEADRNGSDVKDKIPQVLDVGRKIDSPKQEEEQRKQCSAT